MKSVFADTYYYAALISPADSGHRRAVAYSLANSRPIVTTAWVITELADGLCKLGTRPTFDRLLRCLHADPATTIVPADQDLMDRGIALYLNRPDKEWSLTDCISFVVMAESQITDALTSDKHFEQAGFVAVLK